MKIKLSPLTSDIVLSIYIVVTLAFRFYYESAANVTPGLSLVFGICFLLFPVVLIKAKFLNPNWFGLFKSRKS